MYQAEKASVWAKTRNDNGPTDMHVPDQQRHRMMEHNVTKETSASNACWHDILQKKHSVKRSTGTI